MKTQQLLFGPAIGGGFAFSAPVNPNLKVDVVIIGRPAAIKPRQSEHLVECVHCRMSFVVRAKLGEERRVAEHVEHAVTRGRAWCGPVCRDAWKASQEVGAR